jgi:diguanylate cyclase (GGDEF)-like protein
MIKNMLNTNDKINELSARIYSETLGNQQYINEVIKELYKNKTLYFDKTTGEWVTGIEDKEILIPKNLEQRLELNISSLGKEEINVLKKISIFQTALSEKIILKYVITNLHEINIYRNLKAKGFLEDKISDQGILIGFTNDLLKNILYLKLSKEEKLNKHFNASIFLEEILFETDYYIEELLIHLERGNSYEKAYFYTVIYAKAQGILGNIFKAIFYYKKALNYNKALSRNDVAISIAKLYEKNSKHKKSYKYFKIANKIAIKNNEFDKKIYTLLQMIIIKINDITNVDTHIDYSLNYVRRLLQEEAYPKGEAFYHYALALKYRLEYDYELTLLHANKAFIICEENKIKGDLYGWITLLKVQVYIKQGKYDEARKKCLEAEKIFLNNNNINGELHSKLLHADICKEEGQSNQIILIQYLEITKLSNKYKIYKKEILSLICIAIIYNQEKKYEKAEEYLFKALETEREKVTDVYSFSIFNEFCLLYIKLGKINLATKYYYLTKQMEKEIKLSEEDVIKSNYTYSLYNLLICNNNKAYYYLKKIYALIFSSKNFHYKTIVCNYYELMLYKCKNEDSIKIVYGKLNDKIQSLQNEDAELEIRINTIRRILLLGYKNSAKEMFLNLKGYPKEYNVEGLYIYLEFNFRNKTYYNFLINKALRICSYIDNHEIKADIYTMIGEKYSELKCYVLGMNYYYESIALHISTINALPQKDKLLYINNSRFLKTREQFIKCINYDLNIKMNFKEFEVVKINREVDLILKELGLTNIFGNTSLLQLSRDVYSSNYYNDLSDIYKVFEKFSSDTISSIENIIKYMARLTLSDQAMLVIENNEGKNEVICSYRINDKNEINKYFSLKFDSKEDIFVICNTDDKIYKLEEKVLKNGIKACMYMKIINKEKYVNSGAGINARLILISNNAMNYINYESKKIIEKFKPFLVFLLEKHNLTISSTLDKLTGVYNRKYFEEALLFLLDDVKLKKKEFAVVMFDIDDFKSVNDKYGHQTGDEVLVKLTTEVKKYISENDIIGRYGGEEFIIILPNINKEQAVNIVECIRTNVEEAKILGDKRQVTISIGIAMSNYESLSSEEIIQRADQALYKAKHEGKNKCILWQNDFGINTNTSNELTGVILGNASKDYKLALIFKSVANIIKNVGNKKEKKYKLMSKIIEVIECEVVTVFIIKDKKIIDMNSSLKNKQDLNKVEKFNFKLVYETIKEKKGRYLIDWENVNNGNGYEIPDWKSICLTPVICNGEILAILYLSVSVNKKEYTLGDYNLLNCFAELSIPIFY